MILPGDDLEVSVGAGTRFGDADSTFLNENKGGTRIYAQTWATFRL